MQLPSEPLRGTNLESSPCPLGCPPSDEWVLDSYDYHNRLPGKFQVVKCRTCGLMRTEPRPSADTIGLYYPTDYAPYAITTIKPAGKTPAWKKLLRSAMPFYNQHLPKLKPGYLLEVGCASGAFLQQMAQLGWQVEGIEPAREAAQAAGRLGCRVQAARLEAADPPLQLLDLVAAWMALEHLHQPIPALQKLASWSKAGGWLALSVPNCASFEFSLFRGYNYGVHLPAHLYHFTPRTLRKVLWQGGWRVERIFHQRTLGNLFGSLGYYLRERGHENRLVDWLSGYPLNGKIHILFYPVGWLLSLAGQTGRMTVWARKREEQ
jgi:SAM-dependent methyltransferase